MSPDPVIDIDEETNASGPLVINCFPSVGFVSSIVAHFLVDKLGLELLVRSLIVRYHQEDCLTLAIELQIYHQTSLHFLFTYQKLVKCLHQILSLDS